MKGTGPIYEKSKAFALRVVKLYKYFKENRLEYVMSKQLLRCGTSIGANVREAVYAQSRADFLSKMYIALKEAGESAYWLELLGDAKYLTSSQYKSMLDDCEELIKILSSITKTTKTNSYLLTPTS